MVNRAKIDITKYFNKFNTDISKLELPEKFTFPFYYEPHPLADMASKQLQSYLENQKKWKHNFGLNSQNDDSAIGKMFGVLVVKKDSEIGFLCAFSGKLANTNHHDGFVPPVFDMLTKDSFFLEEEKNLNKLNHAIKNIENNLSYLFYKSLLLNIEKEAKLTIERSRELLKLEKANRKKRRIHGETHLNNEAYKQLLERLRFESLRKRYMHKDLIKYWNSRIKNIKKSISVYTIQLDKLKTERKQRSNSLQQKLFDQYTFLDSRLESKSLAEIFSNNKNDKPPAGAGECAAPKLLQFAYKNNLKPIVLAEFWWGKPLKGEVRKHKNYYPACKGKCGPILGHMLQHIVLEDNPLLDNPAIGKKLKIIYEDEHIVVVNKPAEFFSVPGKLITDSVQTRMKKQYPDATGPMIVHRLDMSTSGLIILGKTMKVYKDLQQQFISRTVKKRYIAVLEGLLSEDEGEIKLPLRLDIDDRPRQMVCSEHGKPAITRWKVESRKDGRTRVAFYPITGRTHQLRVHAAHHLGLGFPIVGDDLYGTIDKRLHLHAQYLKLIHPITNKKMIFKCDPEF